MMPRWLETEDGQELFEAIFKAVDLSEVEERDLEIGTYTNRQIAEKFDDPRKLTAILMSLPNTSPASKRSIMSFTVDLL